MQSFLALSFNLYMQSCIVAVTLIHSAGGTQATSFILNALNPEHGYYTPWICHIVLKFSCI